MDISIQVNLCKGLRACGIPKRQTHQILNIVSKWINESGVEWTNSRIKDLRQWYETYLAGKPIVPEWFKHSLTNMPIGIWKWVFKLPKPKALGVLSLNTVFYEHKLTEKQKEKFLHGLSGNGSRDRDFLTHLLNEEKDLVKIICDFNGKKIDASYLKKKKLIPIPFPTLFDMTGSVPVHGGKSSVRVNDSLANSLKALQLSWESIPQVTFDFIDKLDMLSYLPEEVLTLGNPYYLDFSSERERSVGRVSVLQQPELKARIVGNPNRILQVTLEPLKDLYMSLLRKLPSDVTFDQESGVRWVQDQLKQGNELAGSDMTSASDLLDIGFCLFLTDHCFGFSEIDGYVDFHNYFRQVCSSEWWCPDLNDYVKWSQGSVLGTGPSFGLLSLTNNVAAAIAYNMTARESGPLPYTQMDAFRVVGDDIIMRSEIEPYYTKVIKALGGEINLSKTLKSNKVAEFAGRIITPTSSYLKKIKYSEPSDNSFMSFITQLGDQAKYFLKPRQRKVYEQLKLVPGLLVPGPWGDNSFGVPLSDRYQWYLEEVLPALSAAEHDLVSKDYSLSLLKAELDLRSTGDERNISNAEPFFPEDYLPSETTETFKVGGDPRLTGGQTFLDSLERILEKGHVQPFEDWLRSRQSSISVNIRPEDHNEKSNSLDTDTKPSEERHDSLSQRIFSKISKPPIPKEELRDPSSISQLHKEVPKDKTPFVIGEMNFDIDEIWDDKPKKTKSRSGRSR